MKTLLIIGVAGVVCFSVLIYLIKILNRQKMITNNITYQSIFQSKEPNSILLMYGLQLITCFGFLWLLFMINDYDTENIIKIFNKQELKSKVIMFSFYLFMLLGCLHAMFQIIVHFNLRVRVDNDTLEMRNRFRKVYTVNKDQIEYIQIGSRRRPSDNSLTVKFTNNLIKHKFTMITSWEFSFLLKEWIKHKKVKIK